MGIVKKPYYFGYGLLEAWVFLNFFLDDSSSSSALELAAGMLLVVVGLAFLALFSKKIGNISDHVAVGAAAALLASALSLLAVWTDGAARLFFITVPSIPNAWLWMAWGEVYSKTTFEDAETISIGSALAVVLVVLVLSPLPAAASSTINALLPLASFAMYLISMRDIRRGPGLEGELASERRKGRFGRGFYIRLVLGIGAPSAAAFVFMGVLVNAPAAGGSVPSSAALPLGLMLFVGMFVLVIRHFPSFSLIGIFEATSGLVVAVCLLYGLGLSPILAYSFTVAAWLSQDMLCWLLFARIYHSGHSDCIRTFAMGQSVMFLTALMGTLAALGLSASPLVQPGSVCLVVAVGLFVALVVLTWPSPQEKAAVGMGALETDGQPSSPQGNPSPAPAPSRSDSLRMVARRYGLTSRETEVFLLLAAGRSAPFIRDELFISESTVRSHIKHIHAKTGVATKQDLLSLIEKELSGTSKRPEP